MKILLIANTVMLHLEKPEAEITVTALRHALHNARRLAHNELLAEIVRQLDMCLDALDNETPRAFPIGRAD